MNLIRQITGSVILVIVFCCIGLGTSYGDTKTKTLSAQGSNMAPSIDAPSGPQVTSTAGSANAGHTEPEKGHHAAGHEDLGTKLPFWSCLPFACMLLSIAFWPLAAPDFWHHHFGKIAGFWALSMALPFIAIYKGTAAYEILHILLADYLPFIILIWSLYTVSGGILLRGTLRGTPLVNGHWRSTGLMDGHHWCSDADDSTFSARQQAS